MLGNAVPERTTNFGWPAVQQVRVLCAYFYLRLSFCSRSSSFSNNAARHDLPDRQSIKKSVNQYTERLGNMGFTSTFLMVMSNFLHKKSVINLFLTLVQSF